MIREWIRMTGILFLVCFAMKCWGYEKTEHAAMNDRILEHSVGGFDFDQYTRHNLGIDGGMEEKTLRYTYFLGWLTIKGYRSPQELIAGGGMEEDEPFWRCRHHSTILCSSHGSRPDITTLVSVPNHPYSGHSVSWESSRCGAGATTAGMMHGIISIRHSPALIMIRGTKICTTLSLL